MGFVLPIIAFVLLFGIGLIKRDTLLLHPLVLILAGGLSNYRDLIILGYVRDPFAIGSFVFNSADVCILFGILWAVWVYAKR